MKSQDHVGIVFVNSVIGRGALNGVINLSFGAYNFSPNDRGEVDIDVVTACRLRMDKMCAIQLRDALIDLINAIDRSEASVTKQDPEIEGVVAKRAETAH